MHLATYNIRGRSSFGVAVGDGIVDLRPRLAPRLTCVLDALRAGARAEGGPVGAGVRWGENVLGRGVNCAKREAERGAPAGNAEAKHRAMFFNPPSSFVGHNQAI